MPGTFATDLVATGITPSSSAAWQVPPGTTASSGGTDIYVEGTNANIGMAPSGRVDILATITAQNMSASDSTGKSFFAWVYAGCMQKIQTKALNGLIVGTASTSTVTGIGYNNGKAFVVDGKDTDIFGGWKCRVFNPRCTALGTTIGTPNPASITQVYAILNFSGAAANTTPSAGWDIWRIGSGHTVTDGTALAPVTFADIATFDAGTAWYGVFMKAQGAYVLQGKLFFGTATQIAATVFKDTAKVILLPDQPVDSGFYELRATGTAAFSTTVQTGNYAAGLVSGGCVFSSIATQSKLRLSVGNAYGLHKHYGMSASLAASTLNAGSELRSCGFTSSEPLTPAGATVVGSSFAGGTDAALVLTAPGEDTPISGLVLSGNPVGIRITAAGTYTLSDITFTGNTVDIQNTSIGAVIINVVNGSNPVTTQNTGGGTTTINVTAGATVNSLTTGSRVLIKRVDTGAVLFNGVESLGSVSYSGTYIGQVNIVVRNATTPPFYKEWSTLVTLVSGSTVSVTAQQVLDQ